MTGSCLLTNSVDDRSVDRYTERSVKLEVESDYDLIKNPNQHCRNEIWEKYYKQIVVVCKNIGFKKSFNYLELLGEAYLFFDKFCDKYDPYYNESFYPFDKSFFAGLYFHLKGFCQRFYYRRAREQPTSFSFTNYDNTEFAHDFYEKRIFKPAIVGDENCINDKNYLELLTTIPDGYDRVIMDMTVRGYSQTEISKVINISQSRISTRIKALKKNYDDINHSKKNKIKLTSYQKKYEKFVDLCGEITNK